MIKMVTKTGSSRQGVFGGINHYDKNGRKKDIVLGDSWEIGIIMMNKLLQHKERIHGIRR